MTTLVKIGNSKGIRIPKPIIEQAELEGKGLTLKVVDEGLLISPVRKSRAGWRASFEKAGAAETDEGIDQEWLTVPLVDDGEWKW